MMFETLADSGDLTRLLMVWTALTGLPGHVIYMAVIYKSVLSMLLLHPSSLLSPAVLSSYATISSSPGLQHPPSSPKLKF